MAADRFWWAASLGAYGGHSETILEAGIPSDSQHMWWSKGGELRGASPSRILWFKQYQSQVPQPTRLIGVNASMGCTGQALVVDGSFALYHLRTKAQCTLSLPGLRTSERLRVIQINWWQMTKTVLFDNATNDLTVQVGQFGQRLPYVVELRFAGSRDLDESGGLVGSA